jgi:hypothetical protein
MSSSSVQFKGLNSVIAAYENREVPAWSLWQGKQFMFKYEGNDIGEGSQQLQTILEALQNSSNAIYTLKVYEDVPGGKIKNNTPDDGSFNFKLNAENQEITVNQYGALRKQDKLEQELAEIKQMLLEREEEEEPQSKLGLIGEILNDPGISQIVQPLLMKFLGISGAPTPQTAMRSISGINDDAPATLEKAIAILKQADPKLSEHLMKLANLSKESPDSFKFLLNTLDGM